MDEASEIKLCSFKKLKKIVCVNILGLLKIVLID